MTHPVSIVTPSYSGDFDACRLLCESIDKYVTGQARHYIVVGPEDVAQFSILAGPGREIVDAETLLPRAFWRLPKFATWRGRRLSHGSGLGWPIYGWHLQQIRKIAMTLAQPYARVICVDSDNCFIRPFDLAKMAGGERSPLFTRPGGITASRPRHVVWQHNAYRLLGLDAPPLPSDDFIGPMIVWDKAAVVAMTERVERTTHRRWWQALGRVRQFAEYLIYAAAVRNDADLMAGHVPVYVSPCLVYWEGPALDAVTLSAFATENLRPEHCAITIQSFTDTPTGVIRAFAFDRAEAKPARVAALASA